MLQSIVKEFSDHPQCNFVEDVDSGLPSLQNSQRRVPLHSVNNNDRAKGIDVHRDRYGSDSMQNCGIADVEMHMQTIQMHMR